MVAWRDMSVSDMEGLLEVADVVHPGLPESAAVFEERVRLFPAGCLILADDGGQVCGYAISHPIRSGQPPALDSFLGAIAPDADQYYIHDLAILPSFRLRRLATECLSKLLAIADHYATTSLVSVYDTTLFWKRFGFTPEPTDRVLSEKLCGYGEDATYLLRRNGR